MDREQYIVVNNRLLSGFESRTIGRNNFNYK